MIKEFQGAYRFLSNFWPAKVVFEGMEFKSVEAAYQASKFPREDRVRFTTMAAYDAKKAGRGRRREDAESVMYELCRSKFADSEVLTSRLIGTGNEVLQEGNRWGDRFWGVDLKSGQGENRLGKILMRVRDEIKESRVMRRRERKKGEGK